MSEIMAQPYVLPNRKAFADSIVRIFKKYRDDPSLVRDQEDQEEDACLKLSSTAKNTRELLSHQKVVRDYLLMETPYRGLLLYHGLGTGKTCSSIAVAESLMNNKKVFVLAPASLVANYRGEIRKCGDPIYAFEQHWEVKQIRTLEDKEQGKALGISEGFLDTTGKFYVTIPDRQPNYKTLPRDVQAGISKQIDDIINTRFTFINYNGISSANFEKIFPPENPHMFDDSVIIIDEAHNLIGSVVSERALKLKIYDMMYHAKNAKIVCLSGTPVVNRPHEIAFMMNLIRGPIERISIPMKSAIAWDEGAMTTFFRTLKDVDTIEYNSVKRIIQLTRNPPYFESVYNDKGERIAVQYNKEFEQERDIKKWVDSWKAKYEAQFAGNELAEPERMTVDELECLPSKFEDFMNMFIDGLKVKNPMLFGRRIQGLVSYFRGADERLLPKRIDEENTLVKIPMSDEQFLRYLEARWEEVKRESRQSRSPNLNDDFGSYRMTSRMVCNYAVPPELKIGVDEATNEEQVVPKEDVLVKLKAEPDRFLSPDGLRVFSPKMAKMLEDLKRNVEGFKNQFIYSQYRTLEGLGVFGAILEHNGFQPYKLIKRPGGIWEEDPSMKPGVPAFAMYVGGNEEERELYRQIFNEKYDQTFPQALKDSIKEHRLCVFMASRAGAEGITLANVRNVYIMEPYWNPALIDQAIGRAIRICSHSTLPIDQRTVDVKLYMSVFTDEQRTTNEGFNIVSIRRNDMVLKRYEGDEPRETFMSSDEYLYETAYEKGRIIKNIALILKQAAIDCEIHRRLHAKESPVIQCMRFDTTAGPEDLAFSPNFKTDENDTLYLRNIVRRKRRLQIIRIKGMVFVLDPDTNEVFDASAFQDTKALIRLGTRSSPSEIRFFTSVVS